ncbi:D-alanyl-D-alanine carboxypeptidase dacB [Anoxybacillus sp. B7M1]|uniref:D-alanyl-D-alanine carboxypeptidase n=1 Tax=Anoxybacteroides rupiense TaxID=311460 RepID=A0ABT5VZD5_9BACL|nr:MULTISPECIES: D-alanyl-D-alanine carboxypeptidase family protein [Anoxybacillus]ANB57230.1 D-alanyl-D-alanine carboxypeptidase dacB [Anoxybacillus sp. B2M1]ANB64464.1 D-alanyl-D-alanine carboxypeptidase dacB [Anoxybacillus sp. B7M1]MDE8562441.1 D-alanyl-D-alanine carboxypeptidase [Anoxybacillus rupiensis]OQM45087.1 D-alanyl-D-alanine carboxypeptidase [Anoxybacillus sp. UARK-01]QHC04619.1 D-alanyl-D-alanine carboxypeptidase [Anoxybacillus sp. PDR2]
MEQKKRWMMFIIALAVIFSCIPMRAEAQGVSAQSAILMEQSSGRILFEKDAFTKRRIASITKIMTAIIAIESGKMNDTVTVSSRAVRTEGSSVYLKEGEKIKLRDLVYGLMLRSGNDAAVAIAEHVGGSVEGFVFLMNQKALEIGMKNTHFANPHGLDDSEDHYSTAYDMALLMRYAMQNKEFRKISGTKTYRAPNPDEKWDRIWRNKNKLLTNLYEYCTGGKTGYTKKAKRTLVTTASKEGLNLIAVTLNAPDDWNDHISMYEYGFDHYVVAKINSKKMGRKVDDRFYRYHIQATRDLRYPVTDKEMKKLRLHVQLIRPKKQWKKDQELVPKIVGKATLYLNGEAVDEVPLLYKPSLRQTSKDAAELVWKQVFFLGVGGNG